MIRMKPDETTPINPVNAPKNDSSEESGYLEAPASVNTRLKSKNGFIYQWTMRDQKNANLFYKIAAMEAKWLAEGFTPVDVSGGYQKKEFKKPDVPTQECPLHHVPMRQRISKKDGKAFFSHSQGNYPNLEWCMGQGFPGEIDA